MYMFVLAVKETASNKSIESSWMLNECSCYVCIEQHWCTYMCSRGNCAQNFLCMMTIWMGKPVERWFNSCAKRFSIPLLYPKARQFTTSQALVILCIGNVKPLIYYSIHNLSLCSLEFVLRWLNLILFVCKTIFFLPINAQQQSQTSLCLNHACHLEKACLVLHPLG